MKIIIIGGVAGGATTAARIRRSDETAEIILLEKGKYISYANCGLPYYIGDVIEEREKLFVQTPEAFGVRFRVDVRTENEVIFIDRKKKTVTVRLKSEDTYEESYDKLLISTGASPVRPPLPGIDSTGIFTLRNVADTDRIKAYVNNTSLSVGGSGKIVQPRFARNGMAEFNGITDGIDRLVGSLQIIIYCDTSRFTDRKFGSSCQRCLRAHADR